MSFHHWVSGDGGVTCLPCGLHVDNEDAVVTTALTATGRAPVTACDLAAQITCESNDGWPHHMAPYVTGIACEYCALPIDIYTDGGQPATCTGREDV